MGSTGKRVLLVLAALLVLIAGTSQVQAAVVTADIFYDFAGPTSGAPSFVFSPTSTTPPIGPNDFSMLPNITATARGDLGIFGGVVATNVVQHPNGLGVDGFGILGNDDPIQIDDGGVISSQEWLDLTFSDFDYTNMANITVVGFSLGTFDPGGFFVPDTNDDARIEFNGSLVANEVDTVPGTYVFTTPISVGEGDVLTFTKTDGDDDYAVRSLTIQAEIIPEPASVIVWSLLGLTIVGGRWVTSRRKKS